MFSKRKFQAFTYYYHTHDPGRWEDDLRELHENGIHHVVISEGFDLKGILAVEAQKVRLFEFLDTADAQKINCILNPGNPRELYLLPDARRWRVDYIRHVAEILGDHPAVYALLLEEAPTGGAQFGVDRWRTVTAETEGRLEAQALTGDGYQYGVKLWQMDQYAAYIEELSGVVKKARSRLRTTISFHMDALFPHATLVDFQKTARSLDFVIIDAGSGWQGDPQEGRYLTRFLTNVASGLVNNDVWVVIGSHADHSRYQPGLREIREWTQQALDYGACCIGWHGWDASQWSDRYPIRGVPLAESKQEHWSTILTLSRMVTEQDLGDHAPSPHAFLFSYDSFISRLTMTDCFVPNLIVGEACQLPPAYVSDTQVITGKKLQKHKILLTTPCPSERGSVVDQLLKFMQDGGWIIAAADDFTLDEQMRPSDARSRLFGLQQETAIVHDEHILLDVELPYLPGDASLSTAWYRTRLTELDEGVRVLGRWGDHTPAIILTSHGKGGALYIATNPYRAALSSGSREDWLRFFRSIVEQPDVFKDL